MKIGIDAKLLSGQMTGIGRFLLNIVEAIPEFDKTNKYYLFAYEDIYYRNDFYEYCWLKKSKFPRQIYEHYWLNKILPLSLAEKKIDIFFTPYVHVPLTKGSWKNISVVHDAIPIACKDSYSRRYRQYMRFLVPRSVNRSEVVITVSESSKTEIIRYYRTNGDKIRVMYLWTNNNYIPRTLSPEEKSHFMVKYGLPEKFILYVGTIEHRKNISGLIKISDLLSSKGYNLKFVLVGKKGYASDDIITEIEKRKDRFLLLDFVEEKDLPFIYNLSTLFLFPSSYEGFGLPPLEAMKSGIPVLTSNNTSLPEVVGSGGIMLDYQDYEGFSMEIIKLLEDKSYFSRMSKNALIQAAEFTPEKQLPKLLSIFESIKEQGST